MESGTAPTGATQLSEQPEGRVLGRSTAIRAADRPRGIARRTQPNLWVSSAPTSGWSASANTERSPRVQPAGGPPTSGHLSNRLLPFDLSLARRGLTCDRHLPGQFRSLMTRHPRRVEILRHVAVRERKDRRHLSRREAKRRRLSAEGNLARDLTGGRSLWCRRTATWQRGTPNRSPARRRTMRSRSRPRRSAGPILPERDLALSTLNGSACTAAAVLPGERQHRAWRVGEFGMPRCHRLDVADQDVACFIGDARALPGDAARGRTASTCRTSCGCPESCRSRRSTRSVSTTATLAIMNSFVEVAIDVVVLGHAVRQVEVAADVGHGAWPWGTAP